MRTFDTLKPHITITLLLFALVSLRSSGQIIAPDTVCAGTPVNFSTPVQAKQYIWLTDSVNINQLPGTSGIVYSGSPLNTSVFVTLAKDGSNFYGFSTNYYTNEVVRYDFGASLSSTPTTVNLGMFGLLNSGITEGIDVINDNGNWYGFVVGGNDIVRLDFGASLSNTPTAVLYNLPTLLAWPHQITMKQWNGQWHAFVANRNGSISRLDFGTNITSTPTGVSLPLVGGLANPCNFSLIEENGNWYMLVTNLINATMTRLEFGPNLTNTNPTGVNLMNPGNTLNLPRGIVLIRDCNQLYGYAVNENGTLIQLNFNNSITNVPTVVSTNTLMGGMVNSLYPFVDGGQLQLLYLSIANNSLSKVAVQNLPTVAANLYGNSQFTYVFTQPGTYNMTLWADQANYAGPYAFCKPIVVIGSVAPFLPNDTVICSGNTLTLDASVTGATSYQWNTGSTNSSISVTQSGLYWVQTTASGCSGRDSINVTFAQTPVINPTC